jgi:hypothetical protein
MRETKLRKLALASRPKKVRIPKLVIDSNYCQFIDKEQGKKCNRKAVSRYQDGLGYCNFHLQAVRATHELKGII